MRALDYTDFVRVEGTIVCDTDGKYKSKVNAFNKPVVNKHWYTKERKDLVNIILKLKTITFNEVVGSVGNKVFSIVKTTDADRLLQAFRNNGADKIPIRPVNLNSLVRSVSHPKVVFVVDRRREGQTQQLSFLFAIAKRQKKLSIW